MFEVRDNFNCICLKDYFVDQGHSYFLMEIASNGTLDDKIKRKNLSMDAIRFIVAEIVLGLEFCHSKNIIHRDLKPENIMFDSDNHVKICDFGEAKKTVNLDRNQLEQDYD